MKSGNMGLGLDEKGMTLAELTAGMALALTILIAAGSILLFSGNLFQSIVKTCEARQATQSLSTLITDQLAYADSVTIGTGESSYASSGYYELYFSKDGRVYFNGRDLYQDLYYNSRRFQCTVAYQASRKRQTLLDMEVALIDREDKVLDSQKVVIRLWNLETGRGNQGITYIPDSRGRMDSLETGLSVRYRFIP